jgi:2-dehydropantoate 2-reductase
MKILVLGAGAVGGYFGGRLAQAGADVSFLVRDRRYAQLRQHGLQIRSPLGDADVSVAAIRADELQPAYDAVLLTCKAYDLDAAMDAVAPAMHRDCAIVPLLNGLAHLDRLGARFGADRIMPGTCLIDAELLSDGVIRHGGTMQRLLFGEFDGARSARADALAADLATTTFDWQLDADIVQRLWDKLAFLAALAATTCLFRANVREIMAAPGGRDVMERTLAANLAVAQCEGHPLGEAAEALARSRLTDAHGDWSASLLRDVEAGGRTEADHIIGWMLDRVRRHQLDDTILALAYTALKAYEERRDTRTS